MEGLPLAPRRLYVTKLAFRAASIVFAIIQLGILASSSDVEDGLGMMGAFGPPVCASIVWNIAEGVVIVRRVGHFGIHSVAIVVVDLLIFLGYIVALALANLFFYDGEVADYNKRYLPLMTALDAFAILDTLAHFAVFVIGCIETDRRNRKVLPDLVAVPRSYLEQVRAAGENNKNNKHDSL